MIERLAQTLKIDAPALFSTENYPIKSKSELQNELIGKFEQFLSAIIIEMEERNN
ncbi:MAG: hypothetical protein LBH16_10430 [Treponema sp.]|jgi:hypothetical protein|nr:hypothetical protein [Treponema sp.]